MGIAIGVGLLVVVVVVALGMMRGSGGGGGFGAGARFPPGTKAFESEMSLGIVDKMLEGRERELAAGPDGEKRALLEKQIANLRKQRSLHQAVVDAGDTSRGKMSIGVNPDADHID